MIADIKAIIACVPEVGLVAAIWLAVCACLWMLARQGRRRFSAERR